VTWRAQDLSVQYTPPRRPDNWTAVFRVVKRLVLPDWVNYTASQPRMPVPRSQTFADPLGVFPEVTYERPQQTWLAAIFMHHLPPFCKCLYPQERCIDKQQAVACCHNITSRQPVCCSRLQQVSCLVSLVLFVKSPALKNGHSLLIFTKRVLGIYRESTRSETSGKNRKCGICTCASSNRSSVVTTTTKPFDTNIAGDRWHIKMAGVPCD
jgi:hypothetical protein